MFPLLVVLLCTAAVSARQTFVVGGSEALVGAWKYQLSLRAFGSHTCGASLISAQWAMTAAHCAYRSASAYTVVAGMHDQAWNEGNPESHRVESWHIHPNYKPSGNYPNDIALAKLSTAVDMTNTFVELAVMAPNDGHTYAGDECFISGWGLMRDGGSVASRLQEARVDCPTNARCREFWGSSITSGHICIYDEGDQSVAACSGDSGGPMSCKRDGQFYVVGIASWVAGGCLTTYPGAYTRVSEYRGWIMQISGL